MREPSGAPRDYFGLTFEPYVYREYPKYISVGTNRVIAESAAHERELMLGNEPKTEARVFQVTDPVKVSDGPLPAIPGEEKAVLIQIAQERNIKIDKRWSSKKIRAAIEAQE